MIPGFGHVTGETGIDHDKNMLVTVEPPSIGSVAQLARFAGAWHLSTREQPIGTRVKESEGFMG